MSALDLSHLSGPDAAVALRSYPRRFREAVLGGDRAKAEELAFQIGPTGHSVAELVSNTASSFVLLGQALHQVLVGDDAVVHAGVADASQRTWDLAPGTTLDAELARVHDEATKLAERIDRVRGEEWARVARLAGGGTTTALDIAKEAVRAGADNLRAVTATLEGLRR
jgi:hypothetical protein